MATRRGGAPRLIEWTGERCVPWAPDVQVVYEHFHRYFWARTLVAGKRVLDVGSGEGFGGALLSEQATSVLGVDIDPATVDHARLNYGARNLEYRLLSATDLEQLPADSVDVVVAFEIIEHVADHDAVLRGIDHVLAPGGIVLLSSPDRVAYDLASEEANPFHVHELTLDELGETVRSRFAHVELFSQRTATGSRIEALSTPETGAHAGFTLERSGDEWREAGPPSPLYVLAVASRDPLPELVRDSTLADFGLELMRAAERRLLTVVEAEREGRAEALTALDDAHARHAEEQSERGAFLTEVVAERDVLAGELSRTASELEQERHRNDADAVELARVRASVTWQMFQRARGKLAAHPTAMALVGAVLRRIGRRRLGHAGPGRAFAPLAIPQFPRPDVSIVIPVYSGADLTERCLHAIVAATQGVTYEVILVDDTADADTKALLAAVEGARIIVNETNLNYLRSVNRGVEQARGRHIVLLNNDTEPQAGWLRALVDRADSAPDIGVVAAKLVYPDGILQEAGGIIWRDGSGWNYGRGADPAAPEYNFVREVDYGSAAALLVRAEVWQQLGGFDERFAPAYYEDGDLCFSARAAGWRVVYEPKATVIHVEGGSQGTDVESGGKRHQVLNQQTFVAKWGSELANQLDNPGYERARLASDRQRGPHALIIDHMVPMPDRDSGSLRMYHLIRNLRELGWSVTLIPDNFGATEPYTSELQGLGVEVLYGPVDVPLNIAEHGPRTRLAILSRPYVASRWLHLVRQHAPAARVAYDTVDLHYVREMRRAELAGNPMTKKALGLKELELALARGSDVTLVVSEQERVHLHNEIPDLEIEVVPNANEIWPEVAPYAGRSGLLFVGGFAHDPNIDAAVHLVRVIMPLIWREVPGVGLTIVGGNPPEEVRALASSGVAVPGWIEDLRPLLASSVASVSPLRYGAGMKGKVTEALGAGLPVVTTSVGAEGLHAADGRDMLIADDPQAFADRVVRLLREEQTWAAISAGGQELVRQVSSIETQRTALRRLIAQAEAPTAAVTH